MHHFLRSSLLILLLGIIYLNHLSAQVEQEINGLLSTHNYIVLKAYIDSLGKDRKNIKAYWEILREVAPGYSEGVLYIEKTIPDKDNANISEVRTYRLKFISSSARIMYDNFAEKKYYKHQSENIYYEPIHDFKDVGGYNTFKQVFYDTYKAKPDENDLFLEDFVYGEYCGFGGIDPEGRIQMNEFVKEKNKDSLIKWLQSANTEKQVYAVDGLYQLSKLGFRLNTEELAMVNYVKSKKGFINTCSGCLFGSEGIGEVTSEFKFEER